MKGHIPQDTIEELRNRSNIVELVSEFVALKKAGRNYVGLCPFHTEKTPSFSVNPDKQICYCFGCGEGGNEISFLMKIQDVSFPEAVRRLASRRGVLIPEPEATEAQKKNAAERAGLLKVHRLAADFFARNLFSERGKPTREYLAGRGLAAPAGETFVLGYAPPGWRNLQNHLAASRVPEELLRKSGLVIFKDNGRSYDRFRGRLMFPIENMQGDVIAFGGRELDGGEPKYLNSPESPIYSKGDNLYGLSRTRDDIRSRDSVILVEGYFDLLALWSAGIRNVAATLGTALTKRQVSLMGRLTRNVIVLFDGDEGGRSAVERSLPLFLEQGMSASVVVLPDGTDPDDYVRQRGAEALYSLIAGAVPMVDYYIEAVMKNRGSLEEQALLARETISFIKSIPDVIQRNLFVKRCAEKLGVDQQLIKDEVNRGWEQKTTVAPSRSPGTGGEVDPVELYLVYLMIEFPDRIPLVTASGVLNLCSRSPLRDLGEHIAGAFEKGGGITMSEVIGETREGEVRDHLLRLAMDTRPDASIVDRIFDDTLGKIKDRWYREESRTLSRRLVEARERGDRELCDRLLVEKEQLLNRKARERSGLTGKGPGG